MADGKWVMTDEDAKRVDLSFGSREGQELRTLPNYGMNKYIDNRNGKAAVKCAFCGSADLQSGFGGCGFGDGGRGAVFSSISFVATAMGFSFCSVAEQQIPTISAAWMIALIKMVNVLFND